MSEDRNGKIRVRVNAWVDETLAPLVEALNDFPDLLTFESSLDRRGNAGWVTFGHRGGDTTDTMAFIQFLAQELQDHVDMENGCRIGLEWKIGGKESVAKMEAPYETINDLATALHKVASRERAA